MTHHNFRRGYLHSRRFLRGLSLRGYVNTILIFLGVVIILGLFLHQAFRPVDVLKNWTIETSIQGKNGKLPVYHPNETLEFISTSVKLETAEGTTTRMITCDATQKQPRREIQLDTLVAGREPGYNAPAENAIVIPDVVEFDGLPRTCRLVIFINYKDVALWRDAVEVARTNDFKVEEDRLDAAAIRSRINDLTERIRELEKLLAIENSTEQSTGQTQSTPQYIQPVTPRQNSTASSSTNRSTTNNTRTTTNNTTNNNGGGKDEEQPSGLRTIPLVDGLLKGIGL